MGTRSSLRFYGNVITINYTKNRQDGAGSGWQGERPGEHCTPKCHIPGNHPQRAAAPEAVHQLRSEPLQEEYVTFVTSVKLHSKVASAHWLYIAEPSAHWLYIAEPSAHWLYIAEPTAHKVFLFVLADHIESISGHFIIKSIL